MPSIMFWSMPASAISSTETKSPLCLGLFPTLRLCVLIRPETSVGRVSNSIAAGRYVFRAASSVASVSSILASFKASLARVSCSVWSCIRMISNTPAFISSLNTSACSTVAKYGETFIPARVLTYGPLSPEATSYETGIPSVSRAICPLVKATGISPAN